MNTNLDSGLRVALNDFSVNFLSYYHQTSEQNSNLFYSSISLASALSVMISGADGRTKQELVDLLGFNELISGQMNTLEVAYKKLRMDLKPNDSTSDRPLFKMVNRLYLKNELRLLDDFRRISKEVYESELLEANFKQDSERLVGEINRWIEQETENKIQNAVKQIDAETVMLLINVVYFKGKWKKRLGDVRPKTFTNSNGKKQVVETMCDQGSYQFGQFDQYGIVKLDYFGDSSMYVVLPNKQVNLNDLLLGLDAGKLNEHLRSLTSKRVDLQLPKFTLKTDLDLKIMLKRLGVESLFSEQANLSKISEKKGVAVSEAIQNAFIAVDEDGTEAAAVTQVHFTLTSCAPPPVRPIEFHVNRPFIFLICLNGVNIFAGAIKQF